MKKWLILLLVFAFACGNPNYPRQGKLDFVEVGNFGGFSGLKVSLKIFEDGEMEYHSILLGDSMHKHLIPLAASEAKSLIKSFKQEGVFDLELQGSGNMNYYIELQRGRKRNRIQWGDMHEGKISQSLYDLYEKTFGLVPQDIHEEEGES